MFKIPKLTAFLMISMVLMILAYTFRQADPLIAVSLYKAHLMSLGGWGGYWLDRCVFPHARPHQFSDVQYPGWRTINNIRQGNAACLRRAIIIAASLICVGLAA